MQTILMGVIIAALAVALLAMLFRPMAGVGRFTDADKDGEPDETPEEKRRALEILEQDQRRD